MIDEKSIVEVVESGKVIDYAVMNPADVLSGIKLVKKEDIDFLQEHAVQYQERFRTRSMFRSKFEMESGVLNDDEHPTVDSKYWQAIGEQNVHVSEFINVSYEYKKSVAEIEILEAELEELEYKLQLAKDRTEANYVQKKLIGEIKKKEVEIDQKKFGQANLQKSAQERMKEIKNWEGIIEGLEPNLEFGKEDFELHHPKRYFLRYQRRFDRLPLLEDSAKESVVSHFMSFARSPECKELAEEYKKSKQQEQINNQEAPKELTSIPDLKPGDIHPFTKMPVQDVDYKNKDEMVENDPIVKAYFGKKVRRLLVGTPHRAKTDGNVSNFFMMQPPAAVSCDIDEPFGLSVADARNFIVKKALDEGFDWIFFVDDDTLIPRNALVQLFSHQADIVGGFYYRKYMPLESVGMHYDKEGNASAIKNYKIGDIINNSLVLPSGCTLIRTEVFKKIEFPWYRSVTVAGRPALTEDTYFCEKARATGFDIVTDTGIQCLHIDRSNGTMYGHEEIVDFKNQLLNPKFVDYFCHDFKKK